MTYLAHSIVISILLFSFITGFSQHNVLTPAEKAAGWELLFDGETTQGWRGTYIDHFPEKGWKIENGLLMTIPAYDEARKDRGGSIITTEPFGDFELSIEFKYESGVNSGIKYYVLELDPPNPKHGLGLEYQIWDDTEEREADKTMACLYDLIVAQNKSLKPVGSFNEARIISQNGQVEHWLNGQKVLEYKRASAQYRKLIAESKYKDIPNFGEAEAGHILLQDEGGPGVAFRNIKIRRL